MNIDYSPEFKRRFKKLSKEVKLKALEKETIFRKNYRDPKLKTHKLSGKLSGKFAFWIDFQNRIIFSFVDPHNVRFHSIGGHYIYR